MMVGWEEQGNVHGKEAWKEATGWNRTKSQADFDMGSSFLIQGLLHQLHLTVGTYKVRVLS